MQKTSLSSQQLSFSISPTSSPLSRTSSYSRKLSRQHKQESSLDHHSPSTSQHPSGHQSFWSKNIAYYTNICKDDMLKVLRGRNHFLTCQPQNHLTQIKMTRNQNKNLTIATDSQCIKRVARVLKPKVPGVKIKNLDLERQENERCFLTRKMRMQKWLEQIENRMW